MNPTLRIRKPGHQANWTKEEVLSGLNHFFELHKRYPTAREIDAFEYLPSSRSIQRQFGGLVVLRKELIPKSQSNYTRGKYRSSIARQTNLRAVKYEEDFYNFLCSHFDSVAIHEHKIMRPGNISSDFFIYTDEDQGVVIDLFYAKDLFSLSNIINIKLKRYFDLPYETHFIVLGNNEITIQDIERVVRQRRTPLPSHISADTEANFKVSTIYKIKVGSKYSRV